MTKWMILKDMFMTSTVVVERGFLDKKEAESIANVMNHECDAYTYYHIQAYETDSVIEMENTNLKLNLK